MNEVKIICPSCKEPIEINSDSEIKCGYCKEVFPIIKNTPILLSDSNLLFTKASSIDLTSSGFGSGLSATVSKILPDLTLNTFQDHALEKFINSLANGSRCLIVGAGDDDSIKQKIELQGGLVTVTDVIHSEIVDYVCDVTALPFEDSQFDAVFIIAVLEHVVDPIQSVSEISRVLKENALVFSAIPFMQQVHMGCFDFQRYTLLGHRWLYSSFELIELAPTSGSGSALLWSITSFLQSFSKSNSFSLFAKAFVRIFLFWIKYFDLLQKNIPDFALASYFIGRNKKDKVVDERQLIELYK